MFGPARALRPPTDAPPSMNPLRRTSKEGHVRVSTTVPIVSETPLSPSNSDDPPPLGIAIPLKRPKPPPTCPARTLLLPAEPRTICRKALSLRHFFAPRCCTCGAGLVLFCANLMIGLVLSQLLPEWLEANTYDTYKHVIKIITSICIANRTLTFHRPPTDSFLIATVCSCSVPSLVHHDQRRLRVRH